MPPLHGPRATTEAPQSALGALSLYSSLPASSPKALHSPLLQVRCTSLAASQEHPQRARLSRGCAQHLAKAGLRSPEFTM